MAKGLILADIFYLQAVFAAAIVVFEAPSGYLADLFGRKTALVIGNIIHGLAYFYLNFADNLTSLIIFEIMVGIAASLLSGADLALLYETQKALHDGDDIEHSNAISQLGFFRSSSEGLGALAGGALALWSFEAIVVVQSAAAWMCLILAILNIEPPYKNIVEKPSRIQISAILRHLFTSDPVLRNVVIAIPLYNLATLHVVWLMQPYWATQGISLSMFGLLWLSQSVVVAARFGFVNRAPLWRCFFLATNGATTDRWTLRHGVGSRMERNSNRLVAVCLPRIESGHFSKRDESANTERI